MQRHQSGTKGQPADHRVSGGGSQLISNQPAKHTIADMDKDIV